MWFMENCAMEKCKKHVNSFGFLILLNFAFSKIVKILIEFEDFAPSHGWNYSILVQKQMFFDTFEL